MGEESANRKVAIGLAGEREAAAREAAKVTGYIDR